VTVGEDGREQVPDALLVADDDALDVLDDAVGDVDGFVRRQPIGRGLGAFRLTDVRCVRVGHVWFEW
jgi:hypothetical protein